jgi:hypothetical protein
MIYSMCIHIYDVFHIFILYVQIIYYLNIKYENMKYVWYDLAYAYFYIHLLLHLKIESSELQSNTYTVQYVQ